MTESSTTPAHNPNFSLTPEEYERLSKMLEDYAGLHFAPDKQRELEQKLVQRMPLAKQKNGSAFLRTLTSSRKDLQDTVNSLTIGESYFFRNKPHFDALKQKILPEIIKKQQDSRKLRIWSAGCATGEEPYSISILLREQFPELNNWDVSITATDINTSFLNRAKEGIYTKWSFRGVDDELVCKYFAKEDDNIFRLHADIRRTVEFKHFNLAELCNSNYASDDKFDLVICRNVLIYFSFESANRVIARFLDVTRDGSYLVVGHSEAFPALSLYDVIYSNATYYYKYRTGADKMSQARSFSLAPAPALSIPGIGVKTIVPRSPRPVALPVMSSAEQNVSCGNEKSRPQSKASFIKSKTKPISITNELELARVQVNEGKLIETLERLTFLAAGAGKLDYRVHFLRSIVADQAGKVQDSIKSLKQTIFLNKNFVIGHFYLGVIHEREGLIKASTRFFRNARNLVVKLPGDHLLDEAEGLSAGRLREIIEARFQEIQLRTE